MAKEPFKGKMNPLHGKKTLKWRKGPLKGQKRPLKEQKGPFKRQKGTLKGQNGLPLCTRGTWIPFVKRGAGLVSSWLTPSTRFFLNIRIRNEKKNVTTKRNTEEGAP